MLQGQCIHASVSVPAVVFTAVGMGVAWTRADRPWRDLLQRRTLLRPVRARHVCPRVPEPVLYQVLHTCELRAQDSVVLTMAGSAGGRRAHDSGRDADAVGGADGAASGGAGGQWAGWASQLQEITERNSALLSALDAKDDTIAELETRLLAAEAVGGGALGDGDPRDAKIIDLAKRNRALNLAVQRQKDTYVWMGSRGREGREGRGGGGKGWSGVRWELGVAVESGQGVALAATALLQRWMFPSSCFCSSASGFCVVGITASRHCEPRWTSTRKSQSPRCTPSACGRPKAALAPAMTYGALHCPGVVKQWGAPAPSARVRMHCTCRWFGRGLGGVRRGPLGQAVSTGIPVAIRGLRGTRLLVHAYCCFPHSCVRRVGPWRARSLRWKRRKPLCVGDARA